MPLCLCASALGSDLTRIIQNPCGSLTNVPIELQENEERKEKKNLTQPPLTVPRQAAQMTLPVASFRCIFNPLALLTSLAASLTDLLPRAQGR